MMKRRYELMKIALSSTENGVETGEFLYSNAGFMIAGSMAEKLTG
jgi:hypothetical protein